MTNGPQPSIYSASFLLPELQLSIQNDEAARLSLQSIELANVIMESGGKPEVWTIAQFAKGKVDYDSLIVVEDTKKKDKPVPAGMNLVCRGHAMISNKDTPVVVFRKK